LRLNGGDPELQRYEYGIDWAANNSVIDDLVQLLTGQPQFDDLTSSGYTELCGVAGNAMLVFLMRR
jgi:hypothetical protein